MNKSTISPSLSFLLNLIRALAAFIVVINHLRGHFFVAYNDLGIESKHVFNYIMFFATRMGHEAVIIFFVLSGFLVGGDLLFSFLNGEVDYRKYIISRFARIWVVLIPALLIGGIFDYFTLGFRNILLEQSNLNAITFWGNVFFLQTIKVSVFGINSPLWSLANEFWYYVFSLLIIFILDFFYKKNIYIKIFFIIILGFVFYSLSPSIFFYFPIWMLGVAARYIQINSRIYVFYISLLVFVFSFCASSIFENVYSDYFLSFVFFIFLTLAKRVEFNVKDSLTKTVKLFSDFSFSVYAIHYPIEFFTFEILKKYFNIPIRLVNANLANWMLFILLLGIIYVISYLFYLIFERHYHKIRNSLVQLFT